VLGQSAQGYVMNLIDMVKDKDSSVAATAAEVLVQFHRDKKGFVSQRHMELIARMLKDPDPQVRRHAASTLGAFGPEARSQVLALTEALQDEDTATVVYAITALWDIGPAAESAIPALTVVARNHKDEGVREAAEKALKALRPKVNNKK
jgi:HEAT repeat protein